MDNKAASIECRDDQELLEYLLAYLTNSAYTSIILNEYPDGQELTQDMIDFNIAMALSQGMLPVLCFKNTEHHYYTFNPETGLTALIPIDMTTH